MRRLLLLLPGLLVASCRGRAERELRGPSDDARQLLLVRTLAWDAMEGWLRRYVRVGPSDRWSPDGGPRPVTVGRSGLGWAADQPHPRAGPEKSEGDGRSPAGVFPLGVAFGTASAAEMGWIRIGYLPLVPTTECVDDPASAHYNAIVDRALVPHSDWRSSERMREVGEAYRLGIVVGHNVAPARPGLGSCIFLHLWSGKPSPTTGCTAMGAEAMEELLRWLDPEAHPVLVQLPEGALAQVRAETGLPP